MHKTASATIRFAKEPITLCQETFLTAIGRLVGLYLRLTLREEDRSTSG